LHSHRLSAEESSILLATVLNAFDDAIVGTDEFGSIQTWNDAATRLFGYTQQEVLGQTEMFIIPPDVYEEHLTAVGRAKAGERISCLETERLRKGGSRIPVGLSITGLRDDRGEFKGTIILARSLSEQQREAAIRARLSAIVEASDDAIVAKDLNGVVMDWNLAAERIFGYSAAEMVGKSILTIIPPDLQHEEPMILARVGAGQRVEHYETQRVTKDGRRIEVSLTMSPIRNELGRVIGVSKVARDISDRRRSDTAKRMLAAIVESSDDAIMSKNLDGIITSWNAAAERLFGYKPDEIVGQSVLKLIPRRLQHEEPEILRKLRAGERIEHHETRRLKKNGQEFDISLTVSPIRDETGKVIGASKIVRDISERKAAEAALLEKERLAASGRLAATLAHEVNNPLESITNLAYILSQGDLPGDMKIYADLLLNEVQRAGDITRQTLSYYRGVKLSGEVNVIETIEHVLRSKQRRLYEKKINVVTDFQEAVPIFGYSGELRQVFDNLVDNAIDAVSQGGSLRIRSRALGSSASKKLVVSICDNGSGIPPDILHKIFEPFFTTKLKSGSGVGLWVTRGIVQKHGGSVRARSSQHPSRPGSVFTVVLPSSPDMKSSHRDARQSSLNVA